MTDANLTERQQKWFASVRASLERDTGRSMAEWVATARACPEAAHRARLKWLRENHGLLQNRASMVLAEAFGSTAAWSDPHALIDTLWADAGSRAIYEAVDRAAMTLEGTVRTARKGYTAWSRKVQFAAARPLKGGWALCGLAVAPTLDQRLQPRPNTSWSERLRASVVLDGPAAVDDSLAEWIHEAWSGA